MVILFWVSNLYQDHDWSQSNYPRGPEWRGGVGRVWGARHGLALRREDWFPGGMGRADLERLSKDELIELVLKLQRPGKTSRTSSKPPSTDRKERREQARPGGAKPGRMLYGLWPRAAARPPGRNDQRARAYRPAARAAGRGAPPPLGGGVPDLSGACCGPAAGRGGEHALRGAAARHGRLPQDLPGALL